MSNSNRLPDLLDFRLVCLILGACLSYFQNPFQVKVRVRIPPLLKKNLSLYWNGKIGDCKVLNFGGRGGAPPTRIGICRFSFVLCCACAWGVVNHVRKYRHFTLTFVRGSVEKGGGLEEIMKDLTLITFSSSSSSL